MKYKIKDLAYLRQDNATTEVLEGYNLEKSVINRILKGISNRDKVTEDTLFNLVDGYDLDCNLNYVYFLLENELGLFLVREDNIIEVRELEDIKEELAIDKVLKVGNKTILISDCQFNGYKVITERDNFDKDDTAKAIMICLLKREGYNVNDIYTLADSIKPTKANKKTKPTV